MNALLAALIRQAVADLSDPRYVKRKRHGCPKLFLERLGLLDAAGRLDPRLGRERAARTR